MHAGLAAKHSASPLSHDQKDDAKNLLAPILANSAFIATILPSVCHTNKPLSKQSAPPSHPPPSPCILCKQAADSDTASTAWADEGDLPGSLPQLAASGAEGGALAQLQELLANELYDSALHLYLQASGVAFRSIMFANVWACILCLFACLLRLYRDEVTLFAKAL